MLLSTLAPSFLSSASSNKSSQSHKTKMITSVLNGSKSSTTSSSSHQDKNHAQTSINIFRAFIKRLPNGELDATAVTTAECYQVWLQSRKSKPSCPEKAFQRALSGHITGVDGRVPFDQDEEEAILRAVRRKARWECFKHCDIKFGESGFRTKGFHEKALSGEILKTQPKKRAKRALEKIRKISQALEEEADSMVDGEEDDFEDDDVEEDIDEEDDNDDGDDDSVDNRRRRASKKRKALNGTSHALMTRRTGVPASVVSVSSSNSMESNSSSEAYPIRIHESSSAALRMPIPSVVSTASSSAASLLSMLVSMFLSFAAMGVPWTSCLAALTRAVLLSRGWFSSPTLDQAKHLLARVKAAHPGEYIILSDFTAKDQKDRIILQDNKSVDLFGRISRQDGGFTGIRCPAWELYNVIKLYCDAAMAPAGNEVRAQIWLYLKGELKLVDIWMHCDDQSHIIVERGRVLEGAILPPHLAAAENQQNAGNRGIANGRA